MFCLTSHYYDYVMYPYVLEIHRSSQLTFPVFTWEIIITSGIWSWYLMQGLKCSTVYQ